MIEMHTEKSKIMFSDYCRLNEINYCRLKLKAQLFSAFCKLAKEGERYIFTYWYSVVPLSKDAKSVQISINAVIKDRQSDTEDVIRKIIPDVGQKSLFSTFSSILKFGKNYSKSKKIGDKKMIAKCPKCGSIVPVAASNETALLKEEIKNKDLLIENLRKDNEELMATIEKLQEQKPVEILEEEIKEEPVVEEVKEEEIKAEEPVAEEEKVEIPAEEIVAVEQVPVEEIPAEAEVLEAVEIVGESPVVEEFVDEAPAEDIEVEAPAAEVVEEAPVAKEEKEAPIEEAPIEEDKLESDTTPWKELPEQVEEILPEDVQPEQEAVEEKPEMEEVLPEEAPAEEEAKEVVEEKPEEPKAEDPYQIYTIPTFKI